MRRCAVLNCKNCSSKPSSVANHVSFHQFPKDPETRQAWIYATGRINWTPRPYSTICSVHFTEYDFTIKNGKKFLRSTTVPRFNLNEQNSRYSESQYHNETQAALEFLTGQMFPESQIPTQQKAEVVTVQVIGGKNPNVVVRKPVAEKKPKYFSIVNVFKSEAELKAEKDKINELIRDNVDPSISKILLSLDEPKKKKKKYGENNTQQGTQPRLKNGQRLKSAKKSSIEETSATSEGHYTDTLTREEIIHKLKQRDMKIRQQLLTIRDLQKKHLRDQIEIESLRVKLKISNNQTAEEPTSEPFLQTPQHTLSDSKPSRQQILTQKRPRLETTNTQNHYQSKNLSDQDQAYFDTQNRHSDVGLKKPARQQIVIQKRQRMETTNTENRHHSKQEILVAPSTENRNQSSMIFSEQDRTHFWNF